MTTTALDTPADDTRQDEIYYGTRIQHEDTAFSLREWVERFVAAPRRGASDHRVVGHPGTSMAADCDG